VFEIDGVLRTEASVLGLALPSLRLVLLRSASLVSVSGLGLGLRLDLGCWPELGLGSETATNLSTSTAQVNKGRREGKGRASPLVLDGSLVWSFARPRLLRVA
jgi:hypothetical protein